MAAAHGATLDQAGSSELPLPLPTIPTARREAEAGSPSKRSIREASESEITLTVEIACGPGTELAFLRQQLVVLRRSAPSRLRLRTADRLIFFWLYRLLPSLLDAAVIFQPETLVRWHRSGFRLYWRWKSRRRVGRPAVPADLRYLIRTISRDNPLWGAPRIHGELLKLRIDIAQSTVAKYMPRRRRAPSPGWRAFLRSQTAHIAAVPSCRGVAKQGLNIAELTRDGNLFRSPKISCVASLFPTKSAEYLPPSRA